LLELTTSPPAFVKGTALSMLPLACESRPHLVPWMQVSAEESPDILVVLGAQHSAQRRYREALFCLDKALQVQPGHVRAHYSRGQVVCVCVHVRDCA